MSVHKVGKVWWYSFRFAGRRYRNSTRTPDKAAAERIEAKVRLQLAEEKHFPKAKEMTLGEAMLKYWEEHAKHLPSAYTIDRYIETVGAIMDTASYLSQIGPSEISTYISKRRGQKARKRKHLVNSATINREVQFIRAVHHKARDEWAVAVASIQWKKHRLKESEQRRRYLSGDEQDALLGVLREDMRPLVRFCLLTGARLTSAIRLTWDKIDYQTGIVTFRKFKGGKHHTIPLSREAKILLANESGKHPIYCFPYKCAKSRAKRRAGQYYPFSKDGWRRVWKGALAKAKIKDFRFHDQRHTALSRVTKKAGLAVARDLAGHTTIATTSRYAHVLMTEIEAAMDSSVHKSGHSVESETQISRKTKRKVRR